VRAEIPPIHVITGIDDASQEDILAQLLHSQGWKIIYRAVDWLGAEPALRQISERTIFLYTSNLRGLVRQELDELTSTDLIPIALDGVEFSPSTLMNHIRHILRLTENNSAPLQPPEIISAAKVKSVVVTGSSGAPGRTTLALELAISLSRSSVIDLIDSDIQSPSLSFLADQREFTTPINLTVIDSSLTPYSVDLDPQRISVADIGALPPLADVLNDRRWQGALIHNVLHQSQVIVYVVKADNLGLFRLEKFMKELPLLTKHVSVIYILNQLGGTRLEKAVSDRFTELMSGRAHFILPHDSRSSLFGKGITGSRIPREVDKIAALITSQLR
jgi:cellulose biosynthesis protein BcsQ